jgi:hypothetical protein
MCVHVLLDHDQLANFGTKVLQDQEKKEEIQNDPSR